MQIPSFVGGSNVLQSTLADCELTINLRPSNTQSQGAKVPRYLSRTPGMRFLFSVGSSPVTCLFQINARAFGVAGTTFFEWFADNTYLVRGTVAAASTNFELATMCSNGTAGNQIFVTSGGNGYIFNLVTNTLTLIADLDFPQGTALMGEFFAGYFLVAVKFSRTIQWSALEDGTSWNALDIAERSWASDGISIIKRSGTHIWVIGEQTSEVWYATGGVEVFGPAQESLIEHGSIASFSGALSSQGILCLEQDVPGIAQVVLFQGLQPQVVSTYAITREQQAQGVTFDALRHSTGFLTQIDGHEEYILNNANGTFRLTPVYDLTEQTWHHRAQWDSTACEWLPWRAQGYCEVFQRNYVGDRLTGAVYELSMNNLVDTLAVA